MNFSRAVRTSGLWLFIASSPCVFVEAYNSVADFDYFHW